MYEVMRCEIDKTLLSDCFGVIELCDTWYISSHDNNIIIMYIVRCLKKYGMKESSVLSIAVIDLSCPDHC